MLQWNVNVLAHSDHLGGTAEQLQLVASWRTDMLPHRYYVTKLACSSVIFMWQPHSQPCMHSIAADFSLHTVTVSAESVDGSTPGARVTWSTTVPPECVASVRVEFRTSISGSVVRSYTATNTVETEVVLTGLQCFITYYIRVRVTGVPSLAALVNNQVQVLIGGKVTECAAYKFCTIYII